nr:surfeit locus protein 2 [Ipomoea batatas]
MAKEEGGGAETGEKEGQNLLGEPTFKKLENGRFKCVETATSSRLMAEIQKKEAEQEMPDRMVEEKIEQQVQEKPKKKASSLKKKKKEKAENATNIVSEMRDITGNDSDPEEAEFWMPPVGERWDFDDGGNRWGSGSESEPENDDANGEDELIEEATHEAGKLSKQYVQNLFTFHESWTKRMTLEIGPSIFARRKKKKTNAS